MKRLIFTLILINILICPSYAVFLLDRDEKIYVPGGKVQKVQVSNLTGKVVRYMSNGQWSDSNESYLKNLQRLYRLQHKRKKSPYRKKKD